MTISKKDLNVKGTVHGLGPSGPLSDDDVGHMSGGLSVGNYTKYNNSCDIRYSNADEKDALGEALAILYPCARIVLPAKDRFYGSIVIDDTDNSGKVVVDNTALMFK